jgi:tetratricopeptide (TPR) repeat protein
MMEVALANLLRQGKECDTPLYYATQIKLNDDYYGYIAWAEAVSRQNKDIDRAIGILEELIEATKEKPEAYIKLWMLLYYEKKNYSRALDIIERAFIKAGDIDSVQYNVLISLLYAKTLFKL